MNFDIDALRNSFAQSTVTADNEFSSATTFGVGDGGTAHAKDADDAAQHPRFKRDYKNVGREAAQQRKRRQEHLERQSLAREGWLKRRRAIEDEDDNCWSDSVLRRRRRKMVEKKQNPFKGLLMFSDWLIDIPGTLSTEWTMIPSPVGRRTLVVARQAETRVYFKNGHLATQFTSLLPGGNAKTKGSLTVLDAIFDAEKKKLYLLDLLWWNKLMYTDMEFTTRRFILQSRIDELNTNNDECTKTNYKFLVLPSCECSPEQIGQFMRTAFPFRLDGLLFYYNSAFYIPEQTPLVGWLKPWMLPEILGVPVPELYTAEVVDGSTREFIDKFNKERGHVSSAEKNRMKATEMDTDETAAAMAVGCGDDTWYEGKEWMETNDEQQQKKKQHKQQQQGQHQEEEAQMM